MLKTIWLKMLGDNRRAAGALGIGSGLLIYITVAGYHKQYPTLAERQQAESQIGAILNVFRFLLGDPVDVSTPGGLLTLRFLGAIPALLGVWAIRVTTRPRNEEQQGIGDMVLTTPHSRSNVLTQQWFGFSLMLLGITLLMWLVGTVGWLRTGESLDVIALLITCLNIGFQVWLWGSLGLLLAQFFASGAAAMGISIGFMLYAFLFNNLSGMFDWLTPFAGTSPFHYYVLNRPLAPGWTFDPLAFAVAPILALICFGLARFFVERRDVGAAFPLFGQRRRQVSTKPIDWHEPLLGGLFLGNLRDMIWPTVRWVLRIMIYIVVLVASAGKVVDALRASKSIASQLTVQSYIDAVQGLILPIIVAIFAIIQVAGWTSDEENGLSDMVLTTPHTRWGVLLNRFVAITIMVCAQLALIGLTIVVTASLSGLNYDGSNMWIGLLELLPFTMLVVACGFAIAAWLRQPGAATIVVSLFVLFSYLVDQLGQLLKLPDFVIGLSIFHAYGSPALTGLDATATLGLSAAALAFLGAALVGFQRRDIARGD